MGEGIQGSKVSIGAQMISERSHLRHFIACGVTTLTPNLTRRLENDGSHVVVANSRRELCESWTSSDNDETRPTCSGGRVAPGRRVRLGGGGGVLPAVRVRRRALHGAGRLHRRVGGLLRHNQGAARLDRCAARLRQPRRSVALCGCPPRFGTHVLHEMNPLVARPNPWDLQFLSTSGSIHCTTCTR